MKKALLIFGPTASGKSALAIALARRFGGEIISADSMQIYRGMDIGTAKATRAERAEIPHHCIDICDIYTSFSVPQYREVATRAIDDICARGRLPIVCGGTGLYFDALLYEPSYGDVAADPAVREQLHARYVTEGGEALHGFLASIDPAAAARIHKNDEKRLTRALEIYTLTGKAPSEAMRRTKTADTDFLSFFLNFEDRRQLYLACDRRADAMIAEGLVEEVRGLLSRGLAETPTASQAIGYKELCDYIAGEQSLSEAAELIRKRTRGYAKRQITWFSKQQAICLPAGDVRALEIATAQTETFLKGAPC